MKYKLDQIATRVPPENVKGLVKSISHEGRIIIIRLPDFWVRLDLESKTYAVGAYEG